MISLLVVCLLPVVSQQYSIAVQGRLDISEQISNFLKDMYSRLLSDQDPTGKPVNKEKLSASPRMQHMMKKNPIMHVYGSHKGKRDGEKPINNINVK